jgi:hypothetical protein
MKIFCPVCRATIAGNDVDLAQGRALCRPCGELVSLDDSLGRHSEPPRPSELRCHEQLGDDSCSWRLRPSRLRALGLAAFAAVWLIFLAIWYTGALDRRSPGGPVMWFPLLHVAAGVFVAWNALRGLVNSSLVTLDRTQFRLVDGPVPAFKNVSEATANIQRFEAGERSRQMRGRNQPATMPAVLMVTRDGRSTALKLELSEPSAADWLAARWNAALTRLQAPAVPKTYRG